MENQRRMKMLWTWFLDTPVLSSRKSFFFKEIGYKIEENGRQKESGDT